MKTETEIKKAISQRTAQVVRESKKSAANLPELWQQFFRDQIRLHKAPDNESQKVVKALQERTGAWMRADDLFFLLLPVMLDELRETVAAQIGREYPGAVGQDIANELRAQDFESMVY